MSDVFWISGYSQPAPTESSAILTDTLRKAGIRPYWISQVDWVQSDLCIDHNTTHQAANLFADPISVGRNNLLPLAALRSHTSGVLFESSAVWRRCIETIFQSIGIEIPEFFLISSNTPPPPDIFDPNILIITSSLGAVPRLYQLVESMQQQDCPFALLFSINSQQFMLSVLEKV